MCNQMEAEKKLRIISDHWRFVAVLNNFSHLKALCGQGMIPVILYGCFEKAIHANVSEKIVRKELPN